MIIIPELGPVLPSLYSMKIKKHLIDNPDINGITVYVKNNHWWSWWKRIDNVIDITYEDILIDCGRDKLSWYEFTILNQSKSESMVRYYSKINIGGKVRINSEAFDLFHDTELIRNNFLTELALAGI